MAFPTDEIIWGPPAYGPRKGTEMIVLHTAENAGPTRDNAIATIKAQSPGGSLYAGGGSYHWYIYDKGLIQTVGFMDSAGSLTSDHTPPSAISPRTGKPGVWAPKDWVKGFLSPAAEADTNAYIIAICFSGKAADLAAGSYPASMIDTAARLIRWIEQQPWAPDDMPVAGHRDFQTNRTDPGVGVVEKVLARYGALYLSPTPAPAPAPTPPDYKALYEAELAKVKARDATITTLNSTVSSLRSDLQAATARISAAKVALG